MIINFDYPKKEEIRNMFNDVLHDNSKSDFENFYKVVAGSKIPMSALIGFMFRYRDNWKDNISELIETNNFIKKVVKGENESIMYS